jgi:hypothetical protein
MTYAANRAEFVLQFLLPAMRQAAKLWEKERRWRACRSTARSSFVWRACLKRPSGVIIMAHYGKRYSSWQRVLGHLCSAFHPHQVK